MFCPMVLPSDQISLWLLKPGVHDWKAIELAENYKCLSSRVSFTNTMATKNHLYAIKVPSSPYTCIPVSHNNDFVSISCLFNSHLQTAIKFFKFRGTGSSCRGIDSYHSPSMTSMSTFKAQFNWNKTWVPLPVLTATSLPGFLPCRGKNNTYSIPLLFQLAGLL